MRKTASKPPIRFQVNCRAVSVNCCVLPPFHVILGSDGVVQAVLRERLGALGLTT